MLIILGIILLFIVLGLSGWLLKIIGDIFDFFVDGIGHGCGCIFDCIVGIFSHFCIVCNYASTGLNKEEQNT